MHNEPNAPEGVVVVGIARGQGRLDIVPRLWDWLLLVGGHGVIDPKVPRQVAELMVRPGTREVTGAAFGRQTTCSAFALSSCEEMRRR